MVPRLFHFSEEPGIEHFVPRATVATRPVGREWLNGPLVWAIEESHQHMYLFPRECPRILVWPVSSTSAKDRDRWFGRSSAKVIAHVEEDWQERIGAATLYRYEFAALRFEDIADAGMWVSRSEVVPVGCERLDDLPRSLSAAGVEMRSLPSLAPLVGLWEETTMHVSGIRLRNARDWPEKAPDLGARQ